MFQLDHLPFRHEAGLGSLEHNLHVLSTCLRTTVQVGEDILE
jgi:hypothetical protein